MKDNDSNEILFWKIIHNKVIFRFILNFLSYDIGYEKSNKEMVHYNSIKWLITNKLKKTLIHKVINEHQLIDDIGLDKVGNFINIFKLFRKDTGGKDDEDQFIIEFFKILFKKYSSCILDNSLLEISEYFNLSIYIAYQDTISIKIGNIDNDESSRIININSTISNLISFLKNKNRHVDNTKNAFKIVKWTIKKMVNENSIHLITNSNRDLIIETLKSKIIKLIEERSFYNDLAELSFLKFTNQIFKIIKFLNNTFGNSICGTLYPRLFNACPHFFNFSIGRLLNACNSVYNVVLIPSTSSKSSFIMNRNELSNIKFTKIIKKTKLNQFMVNKQDCNQNDENLIGNIKKLLQMYLTIGNVSGNSKSLVYWYRFGNDQFQDLKLDKQNPTFRLTNCYYELLSLEFGSIELFNKCFSIFGYSSLWFIENVNKTYKDVYGGVVPNIMFKHCNNVDQQFQFVKELATGVNKLHPIFILLIMVQYNNLELLQHAISLLNFNFNTNNQEGEDEIPSEYYDICKYIKSSNILEFIYQFINECKELNVDKFKWNISLWFDLDNGYELLKTFERINKKDTIIELDYKFYSLIIQGSESIHLSKFIFSNVDRFKFRDYKRSLKIMFIMGNYLSIEDYEDIKFIIQNSNKEITYIIQVSCVPILEFQLDFYNWLFTRNINLNRLTINSYDDILRKLQSINQPQIQSN